ncbi:3570_t:CDS:2, partial [Racocetra persica]
SLYTISAFGEEFKCPESHDEKNPNCLYANPDDCCSFYQCANGKPYLMKCPEGLQWNSKQLWCDWPQNSDCGVNGKSGDHQDHQVEEHKTNKPEGETDGKPDGEPDGEPDGQPEEETQ